MSFVPVLHSLTLQNSEKSPAVEGRKLSLVCKVRGSSGLRFEWFKDGAVVNVHQSERNMWQTRIPPNDGETHLSILNIEKAHRLDEGEVMKAAGRRFLLHIDVLISI